MLRCCWPSWTSKEPWKTSAIEIGQYWNVIRQHLHGSIRHGWWPKEEEYYLLTYFFIPKIYMYLVYNRILYQAGCSRGKHKRSDESDIDIGWRFFLNWKFLRKIILLLVLILQIIKRFQHVDMLVSSRKPHSKTWKVETNH